MQAFFFSDILLPIKVLLGVTMAAAAIFFVYTSLYT